MYSIKVVKIGQTVTLLVVESGEKEPLLPEHDSVIVKQEVKERVMQYMREAYKEVMGNDKFCHIEEK